jgi:hypothetical protein
METLDLFVADAIVRRGEAAEAREASHRRSWKVCWGWDGPVAGETASISSVFAQCVDGRTIYAYTEKVRLVEQQADGRWLAVINMGEVRGKAWWKDGTQVLLGILDIWPPVDDLRAARGAA